jgi:putative aldouronate transport system substrate-binding protein
MDAHEVPSIDGNPVMFPITFVNDGYGVVNRNIANPDAACFVIKSTNDYYYVLNEAAMIGTMTPDETIPYAVEQHHVVTFGKILIRHFEDVREVRDAIFTGVENFSTGYAMNYYHESMQWVRDGEIVGLGRYAQQGHDGASIYQATFVMEQGRFLATRQWGAAPQSVLDMGAILDDIINEGITRIILGDEPVDHWDAVLADWFAAGGTEMTADINAMYINLPRQIILP